MLHLNSSVETISDGFYCITKIFWKISLIPHKDLRGPEKLNGIQDRSQLSNSQSRVTAMMFADLLLMCTMLSLCCWDEITGDYFGNSHHINIPAVLCTQTTSSHL